MRINGLNQPSQAFESNHGITWLDYLIVSNPQGVMKVLANYGYTGYLAPINEDEMEEVCNELVDKYGDKVVVDLLKQHPLYDVITDVCKSSNNGNNFMNSTGGLLAQENNFINYKLLARDLLIIIGVFYLAGKFWGLMAKNE
jgi:hypothetical protein